MKEMMKVVRDYGMFSLAEGVSSKEEKEVCAEIGFTFGKGTYLGEAVIFKQK
ncbi:MAG TPA: hypothetical protein VJL89_00620 [Thermodesulfovibrionia bacterium]|nr:hypothetical protein [Thermodesulfovibrionia bacterium]